MRREGKERDNGMRKEKEGRGRGREGDRKKKFKMIMNVNTKNLNEFFFPFLLSLYSLPSSLSSPSPVTLYKLRHSISKKIRVSSQIKHHS